MDFLTVEDKTKIARGAHCFLFVVCMYITFEARKRINRFTCSQRSHGEAPAGGAPPLLPTQPDSTRSSYSCGVMGTRAPLFVVSLEISVF